jgi:tape measure domain-containing protein
MSENREQYIIELVDRGVRKGLKGITKDVNHLRNGIDKTTKGIGKKGGSGGLMGSLGGLSRFVGIAGIVAGVGLLTKNIITSGVEMERTRVSFETFTGTAEKGNALIKQMNEFANVTPFDNKKVLDSAKTLMAFGVEAENIQPTLRLIGNISSGTGKDLKELAVIFGQVKSTGRLMGQDLLQLVNAGFNPLQEINRKTGRSMRDLKKDMSLGLIGFDQVTAAFQSATSEGGRFNNMMEKQSKTVGGRWSTLMGKLQMTGISMGESINPIIASGLEGVLSMYEIIKANSMKISVLFAPIREAMQPLIDGFKSFAKSMGWVNSEGESTLSIMSVLESVFTGLGWLIENVIAPVLSVFASVLGKIYEVIGTIVGSLIEWGKKTEWVGKLINGLVGLAKGAFGRLKNVAVNILGGVGDLLIGIFSLDMSKIKSAMSQLGDAFTEGNPLATGMGMANDFSAGWEEGLNVKPVGLIDPETGKVAQTETATAVVKAAKGVPGSGSVTKSGLKSGISEVKAGAPKTFNINIESLIKEQNFETIKDMGSMKNIIRDEVSRLLLGVVNDVQTT